MKIRHGVFLLLACALVLGSCASAPEFDAAQFPGWVEEEGIWRSVANGSFMKGAQYAPTDAQLEQIMAMTRLTPTSGGANDFFFVVLKDVAQQQDVVGPANAHEGTATIMIFTDRVLENHPRNVPLSQDRGYMNAGMAGGYINLASISLGFGTHWFLTPSGYYGNRPLVAGYVATDAKPAIEDVYLKGKGYQYFVDGDYAGNRTGNSTGAFFDPYGALKFVVAVVIGTLDTTADSQVTQRGYPNNWTFAK